MTVLKCKYCSFTVNLLLRFADLKCTCGAPNEMGHRTRTHTQEYNEKIWAMDPTYSITATHPPPLAIVRFYVTPSLVASCTCRCGGYVVLCEKFHSKLHLETMALNGHSVMVPLSRSSSRRLCSLCQGITADYDATEVTDSDRQGSFSHSTDELERT